MSDPKSFVHLHVHTQYSLLDGAIRIPPLVERVKDLGMPAVAMTDHGNMYGAIEFFKTCQRSGVKPIIGCELNLFPAEGLESDGKTPHLTVLARNLNGYQNLMRLSSMSHIEGWKRGIPHTNYEMLARFREGIIALSGDLGGEIPQAILTGKPELAREKATFYRDLFEDGCFFLEIMDNKFPEQARVNTGLIEIARELDIPLVATNDCHYLDREEARAHAVLMCIQLGKSVDLDVAFSHGIDDFYLKTPEEMWEAFADVPEACENTLRIAEMIDLEIPLGQVFLPRYRVPEDFMQAHGFTDLEEAIPQYFRHLSIEGLEQRFIELEARNLELSREAYHERLEIEMGIIIQMDFPGYFLIVWDFINWAKEAGVPVGPGRGSGAGSLVAYSLGITNINPLEYGLLFERFLNPERVSMPDFDIDFCMNRRGEVIDYVTEKYGQDNVGQIVTYGSLKAKGCIKDVGRALNFPYAETDRLAKLVPDELNITLKSALEMEPKLRELVAQEESIEQLYQIALQLEGLYRQVGMHAAGIVISEEPLWEYVPICRGASDEYVAQYAKNEVEEAGLVKFDFLGLKTLTVLDIACRLVNDTHRLEGKPTFDLDAISMDDQAVFDLVSKGQTTGVFQLESSGFQELMQKLKPNCFEDIVAAVALYRPGPLGSGMVDDFVQRKHGLQKVEYPHPWTDKILEETYGVIVYQEQVMQIAQRLAGFTLGAADIMRRAMGKKKAKEMKKQRTFFMEGAEKNGIDPTQAGEIFDLIEYFAGYGFNKCVVGNTEIIHAETGERTTVETLFKTRKPFTVHALGDDGKLRPRRVTDVVWNGTKPIFEITTAQGLTLRATGNHPVRTWSGWTHIDDLSVGDRIATARCQDVASSTTLPEHELIVLAGLLSEGNTCHPTCLYFYNNNTHAIDDFVQASGQFDNTVARIDSRDKGRFEVCLSTGRDMRFSPGHVPHNSSLAVARPRVRSGAFEWAEALGILNKKAAEKSIPDIIFELRDADIELFLGRLWSGDGFFANATQAVPFYATSSHRLARDVQTLLLRLGIFSGVHTKEFKYRGSTRPGYTVHLVGTGSRRIFLKRVCPHTVGRDDAVEQLSAHLKSVRPDRSSKDTIPADVRQIVRKLKKAQGLTWNELQEQAGVSMKEFIGRGSRNKQGFRRSTVQKLAEHFKSDELLNIAQSDMFWDRIVSIEPRGFAPTYDLTVEEDHNFVANGLIVHNSHSAAYGLITYQTGWLKAHYPVEFTAALLTCDRENTAKVVRTIYDARTNMGVEVMPPDVNLSQLDFSVRDGKIRFGLGGVKGCGESAIEAILEAREKGGNFESLFEFCERVDLKRVNKRVLEALVKCGAFDALWNAPLDNIRQIGAARAAMFEAIGKAVDRGQKTQADKAAGQTSLFDFFAAAAPPEEEDALAATYPDVDPWSDKLLLAYEKATLGFYVTGHPLDRYAEEIGRYATADTSSLATVPPYETVTVAGVVSELREKTLKSGTGRMAFVTLEDRVGEVEVLCFRKMYAEYEEALKSDGALLIKGRVSVEGDGEAKSYKLRAEDAHLLTDIRQRSVNHVLVQFEAEHATQDKLADLMKVFQAHPGDCKAYLRLTYPRLGRATLRLPEHCRVAPSDDFLIAIENLFTEGIIKLR